MFNLEWLERNPVLTFVCSSLILLYIYGISWTIVIVFTLFLLDVTFKDNQGERIYGKPLVNKDTPHTKGKIFLPPSGGFGEPIQPIRMSNHVSDNNEKRPTLQSLLYKKRTQPEREQYSRQPLTAIIKNNISLNSSPTIDLEKKKPLYQTFRSPASPSVNSPSILARRTGSPFINKFNSSCVGLNNSGNGSPLNLSRNSSFSISRVSNPNPQEALEVHGSYLVNKSVLHSPSLEKSNLAQRHFSPSTNITFDVRSPRTDFSNKCSTESVVEALKLKSKRKRGLQESEETCSKKKKDNDELDSTMQDLLPAEKQPANEVFNSKRKTLDVTSTGIQCHLDDDDDADMTKKKLKIVNEEGSAKKKFGLSQGELNELSSETDSIDGATAPKEISVGDGVKEIEKETADISFKEAVKNLAYEASFKTVSFTDSTPVKKQENIADTSSLKLSALKKMNSPYKKLFNSGATSNLSPSLKKKMRKHPVYFTAKINIDEVQQHHEEFGESGVSLKAFRLDKEEAAKRVDSLFDESDSDVASKSESLPAAATPIIITSAEVKSTESIGLFASSKPAILSNLAQPTASLTSSSPALTTLCFPVPSLTTTQTSGTATTISVPAVESVVSETITSSDSGIQFKIEPPKLSDSVSKPAAPTLGGFSFGTLPGASVSVGISSTVVSAVSTILPVSTVSLNSQLTTSNSLGLSFGTGNATAIATSVPPPSIQFTAPEKPTVNAPSDETSKISFSFPTQSSAATIAPTTIAPVAAVPLSTPSFSFSFNSAKTTTEAPPSTQLSTPPVISIAAPQPSTTASMFGSSAPAFNFGSSSTIPTIPALSSTTSLPTLFGQAAAAGTLFATLSSSVATTSLPSTVLSATTSAPGLTFSFGASTSQPAAQSTPSIFGVQSTSASASTFNFGAPASAVAAVAPAAVPVLAPAAAPSAAPVTVSVPSFNPPSTSAGNIFAQVKPSGFNFAATTTSSFTFGTNTSTPAAATSQSSIFGQVPAATVPTMPTTQPSQNIFGVAPATSSQSIFGTAPASSQQSIFGAPVSSVPASQGIFGSGTQSSFGSAAPTAGTFGTAPSGQSAFGAAPQQPSIFGDQSKPTGFSFGANPTSSAPSTGFSFGASTTQASSSMFGAPTTNVFGTQPNPTTAGIFGQAKPAENVFAQQPKPSTGFDFSASLTQGPSLNFGNPAPAVNSGFAPQPQSEIPKPAFNFGAQPTTPSFASNTPASPAFGAAQPPAFASQPFGTSNPPGASGGFTIGAGGSNPPPTRQTQRARRRLRR